MRFELISVNSFCENIFLLSLHQKLLSFHYCLLEPAFDPVKTTGSLFELNFRKRSYTARNLHFNYAQD